jgi:hypothetical protein
MRLSLYLRVRARSFEQRWVCQLSVVEVLAVPAQVKAEGVAAMVHGCGRVLHS